MGEFRLETERLVLRSWRDEDLQPFHAMCSDPDVMATLGPLMSVDETAALIGRMNDREERDGHTFWVMESREAGAFIGFCGVVRAMDGLPIAGKPELGWRMARSAWGKGYVTEAAHATIRWCWENLPDDSLYAITSVDNMRSRAVMERIGMKYCEGEDFDHFNVPSDSPLLRHVLYRLDRN